MDNTPVLLTRLFRLILFGPAFVLAVIGVGCRSQREVVVVTATPEPTSTPPPPPTVTVCTSGCDFTTIQAAIEDERTVAGSTILLGDGVHTEADISVTKSVTIQGQGAAATVVQASGAPEDSTGRVFLVAEGVSVTIRGLTIRHGNPDLEPHVPGLRRFGGAIANLGTLLVEDCVISDNVANGGAGIANHGDLTVSNSTIADNYSDGIDEPGHGCGSGSAIRSVRGTVRVKDSTLSGNTGLGRGGALHIACDSMAVMTNTTISGNSAGFRGGAAHVRGTLRLVNCTVVGNSAEGRGRLDTLDPNAGGGIYVSGSFHYVNTVIAGSGRAGDCVVGEDGEVELNSGNLVEDGGCAAAYSGDPMLGGLADNGGDTMTHAPQADSPLVDPVGVEICPVAVDQRGVSRPQGAGCDIGAFELSWE